MRKKLNEYPRDWIPKKIPATISFRGKRYRTNKHNKYTSRQECNRIASTFRRDGINSVCRTFDGGRTWYHYEGKTRPNSMLGRDEAKFR